eukprot:TRINITY_DN66683_c4_g1_i1.p1 TRINITY_DN66683_c4_g1~~TRINITY_DN66683_c4_g1_i1.p1  ORF type:complete len:381 (-),score=46.78 TRINITY_DN66683_c4_g1_i1:86-1228(-)
MYLNLRKNGKAAKNAKVQEDTTQEWSALETTTSTNSSPYTLFYPESVTTNIALIADELDPTKSTDFAERTNFRTRKKAYFEEQSEHYTHYGKSNLAAIHKAFMQVVSDDGILTRVCFTEALCSLGVVDDKIINNSYDLFDGRGDGLVLYKEVISALDVILNGTNKHYTYKDAFSLFDPTGCGWIIQDCVKEIKQQREENDGINHMMVKALLDIFDKLQAEEEERMKKEHGKKKGKRKKKSPIDKFKVERTVIPSYSPKMHLSYDEFCTFMADNPFVVQAFMTSILRTMESVYQRNRRVAQHQQQRHKKATDAESEAASKMETESVASSAAASKKAGSVKKGPGSVASGTVPAAPPSVASAGESAAELASARSTASTARKT